MSTEDIKILVEGVLGVLVIIGIFGSIITMIIMDARHPK